MSHSAAAKRGAASGSSYAVSAGATATSGVDGSATTAGAAAGAGEITYAGGATCSRSSAEPVSIPTASYISFVSSETVMSCAHP